jgi:hypothetical protein
VAWHHGRRHISAKITGEILWCFLGGRVLKNQATGVSGELEFEGIVRIVPSFSEKK